MEMYSLASNYPGSKTLAKKKWGVEYYESFNGAVVYNMKSKKKSGGGREEKYGSVQI